MDNITVDRMAALSHEYIHSLDQNEASKCLLNMCGSMEDPISAYSGSIGLLGLCEQTHIID